MPLTVGDGTGAGSGSVGGKQRVKWRGNDRAYLKKLQSAIRMCLARDQKVPGTATRRGASGLLIPTAATKGACTQLLNHVETELAAKVRVT